MKVIIIISLLFFAGLLACNFEQFNKQDPQKSEYNMSVTGFMAYLQSIDNQKEINEDYQQYVDRIYRAINLPLNRTYSPAYLKAYFYACHQTMASPHPADFHDALSIQEEAKESILFRLAFLKTDEAAQTLVDIFTDKNIYFDSQTSLALYESMIQCGPLIVPYLQKAESIQPSTVERIIECIHSGKSFL